MREAQDYLPERYECPSARIVGIDFGSTAAQPDDPLCPALIAFMAGDIELSRHEVQIVSLDILGAALLDGLPLCWQELQLQSLDDRLGDFVLQREDIIEITVVTLGPDVIIA